MYFATVGNNFCSEVRTKRNETFGFPAHIHTVDLSR